MRNCAKARRYRLLCGDVEVRVGRGVLRRTMLSFWRTKQHAEAASVREPQYSMKLTNTCTRP
jgi:hypothetical protein